MADDFTHLDDKGHVRMVDVGSKDPTQRHAVAEATVLGAQESSLARSVAAAIGELPAARREWKNRYLPAADHFTAACALATDATRPVVEAAAALEDRFQWRGGGDHGRGGRRHREAQDPAADRRAVGGRGRDAR